MRYYQTDFEGVCRQPRPPNKPRGVARVDDRRAPPHLTARS